MAENRIIEAEDIRVFWDFSENIDTSKIDASILRAQQTDLEPILGNPLYYEFIEDYNGTTFDTAKYKTLYDGEAYTYNGQSIYFRGVKQLLCVLSYIRLVEVSRINIVRSGEVFKVSEESEFAEDFQMRADLAKAKTDAIRLEKEVLQYLSYKPADYPLFSYREYKEPKTSYKFYKI